MNTNFSRKVKVLRVLEDVLLGKMRAVEYRGDEDTVVITLEYIEEDK